MLSYPYTPSLYIVVYNPSKARNGEKWVKLGDGMLSHMRGNGNFRNAARGSTIQCCKRVNHAMLQGGQPYSAARGSTMQCCKGVNHTVLQGEGEPSNATRGGGTE